MKDNLDIDIFDREIEYLTERPNMIYASWGLASPLFSYVINTKNPQLDESIAGCLTQIRLNPELRAQIHPDIDDQLTDEIRGDERIPLTPHGINPENLHVFAEWQRRLQTLRQQYNKPVENTNQ